MGDPVSVTARVADVVLSVDFERGPGEPSRTPSRRGTHQARIPQTSIRYDPLVMGKPLQTPQRRRSPPRHSTLLFATPPPQMPRSIEHLSTSPAQPVVQEHGCSPSQLAVLNLARLRRFHLAAYNLPILTGRPRPERRRRRVADETLKWSRTVGTSFPLLVRPPSPRPNAPPPPRSEPHPFVGSRPRAISFTPHPLPFA